MCKVMTPLKNIEDISELVKAGAGEFYVGFSAEDWTKDFGEWAELNRRSAFSKTKANINIDNIGEVITRTNEYNIPLFVAINSPQFTKEQLLRVESYIEKLSHYKIEGLIVSTPSLVKLALKYNIKPTCSTICNIHNKDIAKFYYNLGVRRMILPRDLTLDEIETIVKAFPDVSFEVFMLGSGCVFSDGNCLAFHKLTSLCAFLHDLTPKQYFSLDETISKDFVTNNKVYCSEFHKKEACGLCALYRLVKLGIDSFKLVGREKEANYNIKYTELIYKNIEIAKTCTSETEYLDKMIKLDEQVCNHKLSCYYHL